MNLTFEALIYLWDREDSAFDSVTTKAGFIECGQMMGGITKEPLWALAGTCRWVQVGASWMEDTGWPCRIWYFIGLAKKFILVFPHSVMERQWTHRLVLWAKTPAYLVLLSPPNSFIFWELWVTPTWGLWLCPSVTRNCGRHAWYRRSARRLLKGLKELSFHREHGCEVWS